QRYASAREMLSDVLSAFANGALAAATMQPAPGSTLQRAPSLPFGPPTAPYGASGPPPPLVPTADGSGGYAGPNPNMLTAQSAPNLASLPPGPIPAMASMPPTAPIVPTVAP